MRLSLSLGIRLSQIGQVLTAPEWAEYLAADTLGLIPDNALYLDIIKAWMGGEESQQDMKNMYQQRKAMYGGTAQNIHTPRGRRL